MNLGRSIGDPILLPFAPVGILIRYFATAFGLVPSYLRVGAVGRVGHLLLLADVDFAVAHRLHEGTAQVEPSQLLFDRDIRVNVHGFEAGLVIEHLPRNHLADPFLLPLREPVGDESTQ